MMNLFPSSKALSLNGKNLRPLAYVFLLLLSLCFFVPGIAALPPIDRDEAWFAQSSKQMLETNDYVDIKYQNVGRYKKPIGIYWLQAASVKLLNPEHLNEIWAYRIPSLISATISVLMTAAIGCLFFGPEVGLIAAIMMAGCTVLNGEARLAKTDSTLLATILFAQYGLARAFKGERKSVANFFIFWTALSAGFLVKGPIILLILFSTLLWLWRTEKTLSWFKALRPFYGIPYCLLLAAPWFIAIAMASHGKFIQQSAGHDMFAKIWEGQDRGILPPGLHLLVFPAVFFPFSLPAMLAVPDTWQSRKERSVRFLLGWIIPAWIVFEISLTKLPHYVMPMYPAIAILTAKALCDGLPVLAEKTKPWIMGIVMGLWFLIGTTLAVGLALLPYIVGQEWNYAQIGAGITLIIAQSIALFMLMQRRRTATIAALTLGSLLFIGTTLGATMPSVKHFWISNDIHVMAEKIKPCAEAKIIAAHYGEPSLVFLEGTDTQLYMSGEHVISLMQDDPCRIAVLDEDRLPPFLIYSQEVDKPPYFKGTIKAYNLGRGTWRTLYFYTLKKD